MKASTHTEIYRPFQGELTRRRMRFLPLATTGVRVAFKRKLPLLLFGPSAIGTIVYSFLVHLRFRVETGEIPGMDSQGAAMVATAAGQLLAVSNQVINFLIQTRHFALLAIAWYGAGLLAEDRRLGAHLLYFSRPMTRTDYYLGKLGTVLFYGACSFLFPVLTILSVASFSSPEWSFLTEKGDVILKSIAYALLWIGVFSTMVLAVSSLVDRKTLALAGFVGLFIFTEAVGNVMVEIVDDPHWRLLSLTRNFEHAADWLFDRNPHDDFSVGLSLGTIAAWAVLSVTITARRLRRMEVVA